jgi:serine/threonine protein kinase
VDRECRVMRNLSNHTGIIRLFETAETRDCVYIMMEAARRG